MTESIFSLLKLMRKKRNGKHLAESCYLNTFTVERERERERIEIRTSDPELDRNVESVQFLISEAFFEIALLYFIHFLHFISAYLFILRLT
jgi:hypothetical protein